MPVLILAFWWQDPRCIQFYDPQATEILAMDDGIPTGIAGVPHFALADGQPGRVSIHDCAGRLVAREDFVDRTSLRLDRGIYFYGVESRVAIYQGRLVVR